jgi:hypothetical protein
MDKRYQVIVSSTFADLKEERQAVTQSIASNNNSERLEMKLLRVQKYMLAAMIVFPSKSRTSILLGQRRERKFLSVGIRFSLRSDQQ